MPLTYPTKPTCVACSHRGSSHVSQYMGSNKCPEACKTPLDRREPSDIAKYQKVSARIRSPVASSANIKVVLTSILALNLCLQESKRASSAMASPPRGQPGRACVLKQEASICNQSVTLAQSVVKTVWPK